MTVLEVNFTELNKELADLYPLQQDIIRIVRDSGLKPGEIDLNGAALNVWSRVTVEAREKRRNLQLVLSALYGQENNQVLNRYIVLFQQQGQELSRQPSLSGSIIPELAHQLDRPAELAKLKSLLLESTSERVGVTGKGRVGVEGMGGIGKTVLVSMLVNDPQIQATFPDGIIWLAVGQTPSLLQLQAQVLQNLGEVSTVTDLNQGKKRLDELWQTKVCLLVLDDVWETEHGLVFGTPGPKSRILLTTRKIEVVENLGAREYPLGLLSQEEALKLLAEWSGLEVNELPAAGAEIVEECGRLPLAVASCGGMVRNAPESMWQAVLEALRSSDLAEISRKFPGYPYPDLFRAIQVSVDELEEEDRNCYLDLAVFPEDTPIPSKVLEVLWKSKNITTLLRMKLFADRSLAKWDEGGRLTLHDLQYDYIRKVREQELAALHHKLINGYRGQCRGEWWNQSDDGYLYDHLSYHLKEAGLQQELRELLLEYRWLQAKLNIRGINALLADYNQLPSEPETKLVVDSLRLGAHVLAKYPYQLANQLVGRLGRFEQPALKTLLVAAFTSQPANNRLRLLSASLEPPGGPLIRTFEGHTSGVNGVAVLPNGKQALSASYNNTLKLWDLQTGQELRTFEGHTSSVMAVAILPNGKQALSASYDETLKLWDLETGQELRSFEGHTSGVTAVAVLPNGKQALSASYNNTLKLWDLQTGQELATFIADAPLNTISITPNGKTVVTGDITGRVHFLRLI